MSEWKKLCEEVEKIEGDLSDIGFMIEFAKIWNHVKSVGDALEKRVAELKAENKQLREELELCQAVKNQKLEAIREIVVSFFEDEASQEWLTDWMLCYECLGKIKEVLGVE